MTDHQEQTSAVELANLRGEILASLAELRGDVRLVLQRTEHADRRADNHDTQISRLDQRLDAVERDQVTRADLAARTRQIISTVAALCTTAGVVVSIVVAIVK